MTLVAVLTVIIVMVTASSLPGYLREVGNLQKPFEYAQMYLHDDPYSELIIEYDYVDGYPPSPAAVELLEQRVYQYTDKRVVTSVIDDVIHYRDTKESYVEEDIFFLAREYKDAQRGGNTMVMHVLYLNGEWKKENVLGLAYGGDRIVIFMETIVRLADRSDSVSVLDIESSVLVHEFGHLLALVGIGYDSEHEDPEYRHHCDESAGRCVMASDVEVKPVGRTQPPPDDFCSNCVEDLARIKNMKDDPGFEEFLTIGVIGGQIIVGLGWILVLKPKKRDRKKEYEAYREHYIGDFEKGHY